MLLRFNSQKEFENYFNKEHHTVHEGYANGFPVLYRIPEGVPKDFPVILQSGKRELGKDIEFHPVSIKVDFRDKMMMEEAKHQKPKAMTLFG